MVDSTFSKLRDFLLNELSEAEVTALSQDLGYDFERLSGTGFFGKTRGLLETAQRDGRMRALQARLREMHPEAYAALDLNADSTESAASGNGPVARETPSGLSGKLPVPLLPTLLIGLIAVLLLFGFLLPRIMGTAAQTTAQATETAVAASAASTQAAAPTQTSIPVIDTAATLTPINANQAVATVAPANNSQGVVVVATEAIPVTAPPTIAVIGEQAPVVVGGEGADHPAALALKTYNAKLPSFYRGEVTIDELKKDWSGRAYQALTGFASRQLPNALKLGTAPRSTLDIAFEYVNQPAVIASSGDKHTVLSREYWTYSNSAAGVVSCDTRDYTYTLVLTSGRYTVTDFSSKIVRNGCR
jgi:hypothetical protein